MIVDLSTLNKDIHFPIIKFLPSRKSKNIFERIWNFVFFRRECLVLEHYIFWCDYLKLWVLIPKGFIYDMASVPKLLNFIYKTTGLLLYGSISHDFGYRYNCLLHVNELTGHVYIKEYSKHKLDVIFEHLNTEESNLSVASFIARVALSIFAIPAWYFHRFENKGIIVDFYELFLNEEIGYEN
jgi:hypothetical protein